MFGPMLFAVSIVALSQFGLYYWRAIVAGVARQPVSACVLAAAGIDGGQVTGRDFHTFAGLHGLTPDLNVSTSSLSAVSAYYRVVNLIGGLARFGMPSLLKWVDSELTLCARYAAVQIDRRLQANMELAASLRSC